MKPSKDAVIKYMVKLIRHCPDIMGSCDVDMNKLVEKTCQKFNITDKDMIESIQDLTTVAYDKALPYCHVCEACVCVDEFCIICDCCALHCVCRKRK